MYNETVKVKCIGIDNEGKGIVNLSDKEIHIANILEGETAILEINKRRNFIDAKVIKVVEASDNRISPLCKHFNSCGGCQLQHLSYSAQLNYKENMIKNLMKPYGEVNKIIPMENPYYYRNKINSTVSYNQKRKLISGIYEENSHRVTPIEECIISDVRANKITETILNIMKTYKMKAFDEDAGTGFLRHILIRTGFTSKQIMVVLVAATDKFPGKNNFIKELLKEHPEINTIVININNRKTSAVLGINEKVIYGKGYIEDTLCGCVFRISPRSFYQVNPKQTEILYNKAIAMSKLNKNDTVIDAYCGIGTISLILSKSVKKVIGVELNKDAVRDAITNAKRNSITNAYFYNEDAGDFMVQLSKEEHSIDTVFMDPPRSGSDEKFLSSLIKLKPNKIIYISCNPVTLERDLKYLTKQGYKVKEIQPVDMFPHTFHIESVVRIDRLKS